MGKSGGTGLAPTWILTALLLVAVVVVAPSRAAADPGLPSIARLSSPSPGVVGSPLRGRVEKLKHQVGGISLKPSTTKPYTPCPPGGKVVVDCGIVIEPEAVKRGSRYALPAGGPFLEGSGVEGGWSPADLQSAYDIPTSGGATQTVAVVDAFGYEQAEADLAKYREQYGLPPCTKANGCFKKVNQKGEEGNYPPAGPALWGLESALDLDMVSAVCPECHLMLVQASGELPAETAAAVETAVKLGATEVSNSYGYPEKYAPLCPKGKGCSEYAAAYNHPGVPIVASSGDSSFDDEQYLFGAESAVGAPNWPAASANVIAVGGTTLEKVENARGWSEYVWPLSGSGCSLNQPKPAWQSDPGCSNRMGNDVAAVAEGVSIYSTPYTGGWTNIGGTSVSAPLIAGIEAHASKTVRDEGAEAFYRRKLNDVTMWWNGTCRHEYPCEAGEGYDGPTGWGTPNGPFEEIVDFSATTAHASNRTAESATLVGAVYPAGVETTYYFEYGPTSSYGQSTTSASAGSGTLWKGVSQSISGLADGTYHYRLVAAHEATKKYGSDQTFTTILWKNQSTLNEGTGKNALTSVSCTSTATCMSVGWYSLPGLQERKAWSNRWNGTEWKNQKTASMGQSTLSGVSCTAASACTAVGNGSEFVGESLDPLAERWNGTEWTVQSVPTPEGTPETHAYVAELTSVSCTSASYCMAVGQYESDTRGSVPFSAVWNGTLWQLKSVPTPAEELFGKLRSVTCTSSTSCMAVGSYLLEGERLSLAESWNGTEWSQQTMPAPEGVEEDDALQWNGVACITASNCLAVGWYEAGKSFQPHGMAAHWNGSAWELQQLPAQLEFEDGVLNGVNCTMATMCVAVGWRSTWIPEPFSLGWNGVEWSAQGVAPYLLNSVGMEDGGSLLGVSCFSLSCEAVGERESLSSSPFESRTWSLAVGSTQVPPAPPIVTTEAATQTGGIEPQMNATVNPNGYDTHYHFEYDTKEYKSGEGAHGISVPESSPDIGHYAFPQKVSYTLKGLKQNTTYHFRVVAENALGVSRGSDKSFTTIKATAATEPATGIASGEATLVGKVNPEGVETSYQFEYGTTTSYGSKMPASPVSVGKGTTDVPVSELVSGLQPLREYHFRVVAINGDVTTYGGDQTFTTRARIRWNACTKQSGGKYTSSECVKEGSPNEWESLRLKGGEKTTVTATGEPITISGTLTGISGSFTCETEVTSTSLENPSAAVDGAGLASIKYKGCKTGGVWGEKGCKVADTAANADKLQLTMVEGKAQVLVKPVTGTTLASFVFSGCSVGALNNTFPLTGTLTGLYSNALSRIEFTTESVGTTLLKLAGVKAGAIGTIGLKTSGGAAVEAELELGWYACTKQGGGKYATSACLGEGSPNEWEPVRLKEGEKTTVTATGEPITISGTLTGISGSFTCETEATSTSLENPSTANGAGLASIKYKGCKTGGVWGEKGCKVADTAANADKLQLTMVEGKAQVLVKPVTGTTLASFVFSGCSVGALNNTFPLTGTLTGLYSNALSRIEFTTESVGTTLLKLAGVKAGAIGTIGLKTSGGANLRVG